MGRAAAFPGAPLRAIIGVAMRVYVTLLALGLLACNPKADAPRTSVPAGGEAEPADEASEPETSEQIVAAAATPAAVAVTLHNLCDKPQHWVVIDGDVTPDPSTGQDIAPGATESVQLGPNQSVARRDDTGQWSTRANAEAGGHVWMSSSCQGIASADDPNADPAAIDAKRRETMKKAAAAQ